MLYKQIIVINILGEEGDGSGDGITLKKSKALLDISELNLRRNSKVYKMKY